MNFTEYMRLKKRLAAIFLSVAMAVTSVQTSGGVSYAAEVTGSSDNVQEETELASDVNSEDTEDIADEKENAAEDEIHKDESEGTDGDLRETVTADDTASEETAEATVTEEKMTETVTTEEETTETVTEETAETETTEFEEMVIEAELDGVYQFGEMPSGNGTETLAAKNQAAETYLYEQLSKRTASIALLSYMIAQDDMPALMSSVLNEHPDLYFVNRNYKVTIATGSDGTTSVAGIQVTYDTSYDDDAFNANTKDALACVSDSMSDFEKAAALHDYLAVNTEYDYDNLHAGKVPTVSHNAYGALVNGIAVCEGYALAYKYLLGKAGIESYIVTSKTMNHAWNMVKLDGKYYHVDVTFDDPVRDIVGRVTHTFMFCSDDTLKEHSDWTVTSGSGTVDYKATDTSYQNAFWTESTAPLVFSGSSCYYITKDGSLRKASFSNITDTGTEIVDIGKWSSGSGGYWTNSYSGLYRINNRLFYNDMASIYSIKPDGTDKKTEFTVDTTGGTAIYGSAYRGSTVFYSLHTTPNFEEKETVLTADIGGASPDEPDPPEETKTGYDIENGTYLYQGYDAVNVLDSSGKTEVKADGKPVVLLFYNSSTTTADSLSTLKSVSGNPGYFKDGVEFYAVNTNFSGTADTVKTFVESNSLSKTQINWLYMVKSNPFMSGYVSEIKKKNSSITGRTYPLIVYMDSDNKIQYATEDNLTAEDILVNLRQYCGYTRYRVTYNMDGGENHIDNPNTYTSGTNDIILENPYYREGYRFNGWYKDSRYTKKVTKIAKESKNDITLYAKWTKGAYGLANLTQEYKTLADAAVNSTANGKPKVLIFFKYDDEYSTRLLGGMDATLKYGDKLGLDGVDIYAIETYKAAKATLSSKYGEYWDGITFCYDEASSNENRKKMNAYAEEAGFTLYNDVGLPNCPVICYIDTNNRLQYVSAGESNVNAIVENLQVYCQYPGATYKIEYVLDGGSNNSDNPNTYTGTEAIPLKAATKSGYRFDGWYKDAEFTQRVTEIAKGSTGNITLYAKWKESAGLNAENVNGTITTLDGKTDSTAAKNGRPRMLFFYNSRVPSGSRGESTNKELTAHIKAFGGVDIYVMDQKGSATVADVTAYKDANGCDEITYCSPDSSYNTYCSSYLSKAGIDPSTTAVTYPIIAYIDAENKLQHVSYGNKKWTDVFGYLQEYCGYDYYLVSYVLNGGTNDSQNPEWYQGGTNAIALKNPTKGAIVFEGWYKDAAFTQKVTEIPQNSRENLTLYAKWQGQAAVGDGLNLDNTEYTYTAIDEKKVTSKANGKPKVLFFFKPDCGNCQQTNKALTEHIKTFVGADIYAVEINGQTKSMVQTFKQTYGCDEITYCYDTGDEASQSMWAYLKDANIKTSSVTTPVIAFISADNCLQWVTTGRRTWSDVYEDLQKYCGYDYNFINYELNGGTSNSENPEMYQSSMGLVLKDAARDGFTFGGWYKDIGLTQRITEIAAGTAGDITLYAKWMAAGEGGLGLDNLDQTYTGLDYSKLDSKANGKPKLLVFFSRNVADSQNTVKNITEIIDRLDGVDVQAMAIEGSIADITTFKKTYGCDEIKFAYETTFAPTNRTKAEAYVTAAGLSSGMYYPILCYIDKDNKLQWVTDHEQTGEQILENLKKYCNYPPKEIYKIIYELDGGTNSQDNPSTYTSETDTIMLKDATKQNCTFDGWYKDAEFREKVIEIAKGSTGDITLYAKWIAQGGSEAGITITFVDKSFVYNGTTQKPKIIVTAKDANGKDITLKEGTDYKLSYKNSKNAGTATVIVTGIGEYTGTVEENFIIEPAPLIIRAVDIVILVGDKIPTQYEYEVDGLYGKDNLIQEPILTCNVADTAKEGEYTVIPSGADAGSNYEITYENGTLAVTTEYVLWRVTFDTQGHGKAPSAYSGVRSGDTIEAPAEPREEGYRFAGWYKDPECTTAWNFEQNIVESDITLYAKWLYVSSDGSFALQEIPDQYYTGKAIKPAVIVYDGDTLLKAGKDYQLKYYNNLNANAGGAEKLGNGEGENFNDKLPYVEITGKGNYKSTVKVNFNILKVYLGDGSITPAQGVVLKMNDQYAVSKSAIKLAVSSLKAGKTALKKDKDYVLSVAPVEAYDASGYQIAAIDNSEIPAGATGTFKLLITGIGNYEGSIIKKIYVADSSRLLKNAKVTVGKNVKSVQWTGKQIILPSTTKEGNEDAFLVQMKGKDKKKPDTLKEGRDFYIIPWEGSAGKAEIIIEGIYPYSGRKTIPFDVKGRAFSASDVKISGITDKTYTGKAHTQNKEAVVTCKGASKPLVYGTDYTITYSKNINKGTATMTFIGNPKRGYTGKVKKTFKIGAADINTVKQDPSMRNIKVTYKKAGVKPVDEIILTNKTGVRLLCGKDYTLKYENNKTVTKSAKITVTGKGNYRGKFDVTYEIEKADLSADNIVAQPSAVAYNSKKADDFVYKPAVKLKDGKAALSAGKDYKIEYLKNTQADYKAYLSKLAAGTVTDEDEPRARITPAEGANYGLPNGIAAIDVPLQIYQTKLDKKKLSVQIMETAYTGGQVTPDVIVSYDGTVLREGVHYTLAYGVNNKAGKNKGSVTVSGLAPHYGGKVTVKFDIISKDLKY